MKIDHMAVYVKDLERMRGFYMRYFNASSNEMYQNPRTGLRTYFLSFADGARLEIMNRPGLSETEAALPCGYIHLAFSVETKEQVDQLTAQLKADGYEILSGPRVTGDGYYESCVADPEGNQIEIVEERVFC